jgi:uncharacterized protein YjbJ (UPF0337 family)
MISLQQLRSFFLNISLTVILTIFIVFGFGNLDAFATTLFTQFINQTQVQIATMNRVEAITKNIEGKAQEAIGNITGDPKDQIMGKAKQLESQAFNAAEDMKDKMKLKGRVKAVTKNIEGKFQEARGEATDNREDQMAGRAKQVESQARNLVEDIKNQFRDTLH